MPKTPNRSTDPTPKQARPVAWVTDDATSKRMALVRREDTRAELLLRRALFALGLRYRLHARHLPGSPDIVFPRYMTAVFVHGCFWHQHQACKRSTLPKRNGAEWQAKLASNVARDARVQAQLSELGWQVITAWECDVLRDPLSAAQAVAARFVESPVRPRVPASTARPRTKARKSTASSKTRRNAPRD